MPDDSNFTLTADLNALSAAAQGRPAPSEATTSPLQDPARLEKIAELKAKFESGTLAVDEAKLAAKLVDAHLKS